MKKFLLIVAAAAMSSPVLARPYVNVETRAKYTGNDYTSRATDLHIGYESKVKDLAWYVQGGKTLNAVDGSESDSEPSTALSVLPPWTYQARSLTLLSN